MYPRQNPSVDAWREVPARRPPYPPAMRPPGPYQPALPPDVAARMVLPPGGNWEAGATDAAGRRWVHIPWRGWQPAAPSPLAVRTSYSPAVYTSRTRRTRRRLRLARWLSAPLLAAAAAAVYIGLSEMLMAWAAAGTLLAAAVLAAAARRR